MKVRSIHKWRHTGAAEDIARGIRTQEGVRVRGRWRHISSTQRYTKTHLLVAERELYGDEIINRGMMFLEDPRKAIICAIESGPGKRTREGKAIIRAMKNPKIPDSQENVRVGVDPDGG